jgi:hypothetical protein
LPKFTSELRSHVRVAPAPSSRNAFATSTKEIRTFLFRSDRQKGTDKKRRPDVDLVHRCLAPAIALWLTAPVAGILVEGSPTVECACLPAGVLMPSLRE